MNLVRMIWEETISLFVDDGFLALYAVALIALVAAVAKTVTLPSAYAGIALLIGCVLILVESTHRAAQKRK